MLARRAGSRDAAHISGVFRRSRLLGASAPADDRARERLLLERVRVDRMRRVAGGAKRDAQRGGEVVIVDPLDHAVDHLLRILEVGVEQRRPRACRSRDTPIRSVSRTSWPTIWATSPTVPSSARDRHAVPLATRFEDDEREEVLGTDRRFSSPSSTNSKAFGRQQARALLEELVAHWDVHRLRGLVEAVLLDLVEQRLVADAENFRRFLPIPPRAGQHPQDQLTLGLARRRAGDVLERHVARSGGRRVMAGLGVDRAAAPWERRRRDGRGRWIGRDGGADG